MWIAREKEREREGESVFLHLANVTVRGCAFKRIYDRTCERFACNHIKGIRRNFVALRVSCARNPALISVSVVAERFRGCVDLDGPSGDTLASSSSFRDLSRRDY